MEKASVVVFELLLFIARVKFAMTFCEEASFCNNDTERYKCACYENAKGPNCLALISPVNLSVVQIIAKNMNMAGISFNAKPYELFFKRKIANIISNYCKERANPCLGTALEIREHSVILLRVRCTPQNQTIVLLVLAHDNTVKQLNVTTTMSSELVAAILKNNTDSLNRGLDGAAVLSIEVRNVISANRKPTNIFEQNFGIILALIIIAGILIVVYVVAVLKVLSDRRGQRQRKKERLRPEEVCQNYGATNDGQAPPVPKQSEIVARQSTNGIAQVVTVQVRDPSKSSSGRRSTNSSVSSSRSSKSSIKSSTSDKKNGQNEEVQFRRAAPPPPPQPPLETIATLEKVPASEENGTAKRFNPDALFSPTIYPLRRAISNISVQKIVEETELEENLPPPPRSATSENVKMTENANDYGSGDESLSESEDEPGDSGYKALTPSGSIPDFIKELDEASDAQGNVIQNGIYQNVGRPAILVHSPQDSFNFDEDDFANNYATENVDETESATGDSNLGMAKPEIRQSQQHLVEDEDEQEEEEDGDQSSDSERALETSLHSDHKEAVLSDGVSASDSMSSVSSNSSTTLGAGAYERLKESAWSLEKTQELVRDASQGSDDFDLK